MTLAALTTKIGQYAEDAETTPAAVEQITSALRQAVTDGIVYDYAVVTPRMKQLRVTVKSDAHSSFTNILEKQIG